MYVIISTDHLGMVKREARLFRHVPSCATTPLYRSHTEEHTSEVQGETVHGATRPKREV